MSRAFVVAIASFAVIGAATSPARAGGEREEAERLFREGRALYDAGSYEKACDRFAESQRIDPSAGTALNLGDCYEKIGKVASAYAAYKDAAVSAGLRKRTDWEQFAIARIAAIKGSVPTLSIRLPAKRDGLVVTRDGRPLAPKDDAEIEDHPDPGPHVIAASAPGHEPWSRRIDVKLGETSAITIPELAEQEAKDGPAGAAPGPVLEPSASTARDGDGSWRRTAGLVAGGIGIAGIAFGSAAGLVALDAKDEATGKCPSYPDRCTAEGTETNERARTWATLSTAGLIGGGVLVAAGAVLFFTAPSSSSSSSSSSSAPRAAVRIGPGSLVIRGTF